ncbi:MAG: hypothetical protein JSR87_08755 [Proteobacteria bacterium]|nr:hypothetical protein [Pseudomonadota bacterium]MBS0573678.1 hypothetical protein [Pseudomonadota bacterium]
MASTRRKAATDQGGGALDHWLAQEREGEAGPDTGSDTGHNLDPELAELLTERRLPSGWWMLPALVLALPVWAFLIRMILRS